MTNHPQCHNTLLKTIMNPILKRFGFIIVSVIDIDTGNFLRYSIRPYPECCGPKK